jgi:hypothetical protein
MWFVGLYTGVLAKEFVPSLNFRTGALTCIEFRPPIFHLLKFGHMVA